MDKIEVLRTEGFAIRSSGGRAGVDHMLQDRQPQQLA